MSRSGYSDECDGWQLICWRGAVESALRGKRGQAFLREMLAALDAMPVKRLIAGELIEDGEVCALGAVGRARGLDLARLDASNPDHVAATFGIAPALAREITFENDEDFGRLSTPEQRWTQMRRWAVEHLRSVQETR